MMRGKPSRFGLACILSAPFRSVGGLCAYCEERCRARWTTSVPKTDTRPRLFLDKLVLACTTATMQNVGSVAIVGLESVCNVPAARPERYFTFDVVTGEILPKEGLSPDCRRKAQTTIDDLRLNELHHLRKRCEWLKLIAAIIPDEAAEMTVERDELRAHFSSRLTPYSSVTRHWISERRHRADRQAANPGPTQ